MRSHIDLPRLKHVVDLYVAEFLADPKAFTSFACAEVMKDPETKQRLLSEVSAATWYCEQTPVGGCMLQFTLAMNGACDPSFDAIPSAIEEFAKNKGFVAAVAKLHKAKPISSLELKAKLAQFLFEHGKEFVEHVINEFGEGEAVGVYHDEVVEFVVDHFGKSAYELPTKGLSERAAKSTIRMVLFFGRECYGKLRLLDTSSDIN